MRYFIFLTALIGLNVYANLPPTASKGGNESKYSTTFNFDWGAMPVSRIGTTMTFGTLPVSGGGTGTTSFTNGSVVFASGTTLTGNINQLYWSGTRLGVGTSAPTAALDVHSLTDPIIQANGIEPYNINGGGTIQVLSTNNGAITSGSRLGAFQFGGDYDVAGNEGIGAAITAHAEDNWSASSYGTGLKLRVTPNGSINRQDALNLSNLGILTLPSYTTNGVLLNNSSGLVSTAAAGASGTVLFSQGSDSPAFRSFFASDISTTSASGSILFSTGSGAAPTFRSLAASDISTSLGYTPAASGIPWQINGTNAFSSGYNIGINDVNPSAALDVSGVTMVNTNSVSAFTVNQVGVSQPTFVIDTSATSATGVRIVGGISGTGSTAGPVISSIGTGSSENITLAAKSAGAVNLSAIGSGNINLKISGSTRVNQSTTQFIWTPIAGNQTTPKVLYTQPVDTGITAATEAPSVLFNFSSGTRSHASGNIANQREFIISQPRHLFATTASTITNAASLAIDGVPSVTASGTISNSIGIYIPTSATTSVTNSYGIIAAAQTGATNNYAAAFLGSVGVGTSAPTTTLDVSGTIAIRGGSPASGYVLTSDASGTATWTSNAPAYSYQAKTSAYTAIAGDIVNASGTLTVTLPTAVGVSGKQIIVNAQTTSATATVTVNTTSGQTIGVSATSVLGKNDNLTVVSDGTNWQYTNQSDFVRKVYVTIAGANMATVCSSSPCTAYNQQGPITSITRSGTGVYVTNFRSGTFSQNMSCVCSSSSASNIPCDAAVNSSTQVTTYTTIGQTAAGSDAVTHLTCWGER